MLIKELSLIIKEQGVAEGPSTHSRLPQIQKYASSLSRVANKYGKGKFQKAAAAGKKLGEDKSKIVVVNPEAQQDMLDWLESEGFDAPEPTTDKNGNLVYDFKDMGHGAYVYASDYDIRGKEADDLAEQGVAEAVDNYHPEIGEIGESLMELISTVRDLQRSHDFDSFADNALTTLDTRLKQALRECHKLNEYFEGEQ